MTDRYVWYCNVRDSYREPGEVVSRQRVEKDTGKTLLLYGPEWGWSYARAWRAKAENCYASFAEAKAAAIEGAKARVESAKDRLQVERSKLGNIESMQEPTP